VAKRKRKHKLLALLAARGPATNLRPAGAHRDKREPARDVVKIELRKFEEE
jgi:hypothetical protein